MPSYINIVFNGNPQGVYYSGQLVSGTVQILFSKVKRVRGISLQIGGFAKTRWDSADKGELCRSRPFNYDCFGRENYLMSKKYLIGSDLDPPRDLPPGSHSYNFSCDLPAQLPSSFEGTFGHIRYVAKVTLERPWKFDQTYTVGFTVLRPLDLNRETPLLRVPSEAEVFQKFWCGICISKPLHIKGKLPQTGFVPGQVIPFETEVHNASNVNVNEVIICLQSVISYHADKPNLNCKQEILDLVSKTCSSVPKGERHMFKEDFVVPPVPSSSNSNYSKMIQIAYCIRVEAVTSYFHKNAYVLFPVTIGTIPFFKVIRNRESYGFTNYNGSAQNTPTIPDYTNTLPILTPITVASDNYGYNFVPPSYEEAINATIVHVDEDESHCIQRTEFIPRYPVYCFNEESNNNNSKTSLERFDIVE